MKLEGVIAVDANEDDDVFVWGWRWGIFMVGRQDALDGKWTKNGKAMWGIHEFNPPYPRVWGVCFIWKERLYSFFVGDVWQPLNKT